MVNFIFEKTKIAQHILSYGVDVRPALALKADKTKLTDYCNWLTDEFPEVFETLLIGPQKLVIHKAFTASHKKQVELPTFTLTERGPVYTFPIKIQVEEVEDFDVPNKDDIFAKALKRFRQTFADRRVPRVGVVNEIIFDCGTVNATHIISDGLNKQRWKDGIKSVKIRLENPKNGNNVTTEIWPVLAKKVQSDGSGTSQQNVGYGISVKLDINNRDMSGDLTETDIRGIIGFSSGFLSDEFYSFLNDEQE